MDVSEELMKLENIILNRFHHSKTIFAVISSRNDAFYNHIFLYLKLDDNDLLIALVEDAGE